MAAFRLVYDSRHLQSDCQERGSTPEPYARQSTMGYLYLFLYSVRRAGVRGRALSIPLRDAGRRLCLLLRANISHHQTPEQGHGHRGSRCHDNRGVT